MPAQKQSSSLKPSDIQARTLLAMKGPSTALPSVTSIEALVVQATALNDIAWDCYREFKRATGKDKWSAMRHYCKAVQFADKVFRTIDKLSQGSGNAPPKVTIRIPENVEYHRDENGDLVVTDTSE